MYNNYASCFSIFRETTLKEKVPIVTFVAGSSSNSNNNNYTGNSRYKCVRSIPSRGELSVSRDKCPYWRVVAETWKVGCRRQWLPPTMAHLFGRFLTLPGEREKQLKGERSVLKAIHFIQAGVCVCDYRYNYYY